MQIRSGCADGISAMNQAKNRRAAASIAAILFPATIIAGGGHDAPAPDRPTPDQAWLMLREGNARFASGRTVSPNSDAARRAEVAESQSPFAVILSCADSRVPVERIFDRGIGDLFVVRVAGNVADTDEIGTIEYGAAHLHSPLIVVMGHTACGAVKAVASGAEVHGSIPGLIDNIIPAVQWVKKNRPELSGDELIAAAVEANVWQSMDDLISESEDVRRLILTNGTKVIGAVYELDSGRVRWLGEHPYQERLLSPARHEPPRASAPVSSTTEGPSEAAPPAKTADAPMDDEVYPSPHP